MTRTARRPIPMGRVKPGEALAFGADAVRLRGGGARAAGEHCSPRRCLPSPSSSTSSSTPSASSAGPPQNIVIGGAAGAFPPMIGWAAATGSLSLEPVLLFLIIFFWTPPHFWALALYRTDDYARAGIPMLPVVKGDQHTRWQILLHTFILVPLGVAPWLLGYAGWLYGATAVVTGAIMLALAFQVFAERRPADRASPQPVRFLHPLSVPAVCRAAGRARLRRVDRVMRARAGRGHRDERARPGRGRHRADRGAEARPPLALGRHRAGARRAGRSCSTSSPW